MKKVIALLLACVFLLSGCVSPAVETASQEQDSYPMGETVFSDKEDTDKSASETVPATHITESALSTASENALLEEAMPEVSTNFMRLSDPALLDYSENVIYAALTNQLNHSDYRIENVSSVYVSKEYLEELTYNSQSNVFFGYSLSALDAQFQGERYVFTLGDNGETTVIPVEAYDNTYGQVLQNVAIGTGVILISVTVSVLSGGVGSPAVSAIFATSAKSATAYAISSGAFSTVIAGVITGVRTGDFQEALKAGALTGSNAFKWGAISGCILGGASEFITLKTAIKNGLTLDEATRILNRYPANIVKFIRTPAESEIYEAANLSPEIINGKMALTRNIDLASISKLPSGQTVTNLERMQMGYAPIDSMGNSYELHHIGQSVNSPLAILTKAEHMGDGHNTILHDMNIANGTGVHSLMKPSDWAKQARDFWKAYVEILHSA